MRLSSTWHSGSSLPSLVTCRGVALGAGPRQPRSPGLCGYLWVLGVLAVVEVVSSADDVHMRVLQLGQAQGLKVVHFVDEACGERGVEALINLTNSTCKALSYTAPTACTEPFPVPVPPSGRFTLDHVCKLGLRSHRADVRMRAKPWQSQPPSSQHSWDRHIFPSLAPV